MLKLGYFAHTNFSPSETFIHDLVKHLNEDADIDFTYVMGVNKDLSVDFDVKNIKALYSENSHIPTALFKFGQLYGSKGYYYQLNFQQKKAFRVLKQSIKQRFDIAYVDYATSGVLLMEYFKSINTPFVVHVHGYDITACLNNPAYVVQLKKLFNLASGFIAASHYMRRRLVLLGCPDEKIKVIRYGVKSDDIFPLSWHERRKGKPSIIFLGRLTEKKHPIALINAFKIVKQKVPDAILSIIGDGYMRKDVELLIQDLKLSESIKLYGVLNRSESFPLLNEHWIYAQHSVTSVGGDTEGFAISLAEAALHELPIVSTVHNGITENVIDGKTGFLVPEYDYESMAEKMIHLINNLELAEQMGKAGREHIQNLCNPATRVHQIKELLQSIASNSLS